MKSTFLSRFTPSLMSHETLEAIFVQREKLAGRLVELTRESVLTSSKHYTLLVGPRGIGKTHLVALVYHRIFEMDDLRDKLLIAWLREEEWGVTSFLDLLLRVFSALTEEYGDSGLAEKVESLYSLPPDDVEGEAAMLLKKYVGDRTLLLIVENLDDVFSGLGDAGQRKLRAYLQEHPFCTIVATAQSLFNGVSRQTSPFYGFFRIHHLEGLTLDEAVHLLTQIAKHEGNDDLASFLQTHTGHDRVQTIRHLAGGNHRVYIILAQFLTQESLDELVEPFLSMLDDLTPYYQSRMAHLSPQQRKIVNFLCEVRGAVPVKEIAQRCFMTQQTASSQLKKLGGMGYTLSTVEGRESFYELREPLMRMGVEVKKHRGESIRLFVEFLRHWYTERELAERLEQLRPEATLDREYVHAALKVSRGDSEHRVEALFDQADNFMRSGHWEEALEVFDKVLAIDPNEASTWNNRGTALYGLERYAEAVESYDKALAIDPSYALWYNRGLALHHLERQVEAIESFDKGLAINPNDAYAWSNRGTALQYLERYAEAIESYDKALAIDPSYAFVWHNRGVALGNLERHAEEIESYDKALAIDPNDASAWYNRGVALGNLERYAEEIESYDKALAIDPNDEDTWSNRGEAVISVLLTQTNPSHWKQRVTDHIALHEKHEKLASLGRGLVTCIAEVFSPMVSDAVARKWQEVWGELGGEYDELKVPLRLLDAAVKYRESKDRRILLRLPIEEREVLEQVLAKVASEEVKAD